MAAGVPISPLAMFGLLASTASARGWPWGYSALVVAFFTTAGHAGGYALFHAVGPTLLERLMRRQPALARAASRFEAACAHGRQASLGLLAARWIGSGYSQLFWLLGALGGECSAVLRRLFLADLIWAGTWAWAVTRFAADVPGVARYLWVGGWALLAAFFLFVAIRWVVLQYIGRRR